ncbi:serine/threonine protein kinase [Pyxidicoccus parkwayensis]|uniref:Serine/threonine protein kinase n=1 Tax=Pyxidicoccus parkwayensis TaxID=2813578 RepID=A0ABX7NRJ3_9BACT|nr:serine/threonine-protein kinase [Pyxidicoccus parkwaysis]QSQ20059.1 serine/threonine protein kinase [Pyxidicoccus parkwaysis]
MSSIDPTAISRPRSPDLISGYHLEKLVGSGGMGEVHKATQLSLGRTVAVKLLNPELAKDPSFIARFQKEAAALAALSHPHIVSIVDKGKNDTTYYLVMEFVDGPSLRELIRTPDLDPMVALRRMLEICRAIEYAHGRGVIHRDLKPENILLDQQAGGIAKVSDFGLASFLADASPSSRYALTSTHVSMGTLSYMAPEQRVDAKNADARADIFSLGVILYEWLTGEVPLGTFDPPSRRKQGIDPRLDAIVTRCLKPDPDDRYPSVTALIADLEVLVPGSLPSLLPMKQTRMQRFRQGVRKVVRRTLQTAEVLTVVAALGVLGVAWLRSTEHPPELQPGEALMGKLAPLPIDPGPGRIVESQDKRTVSVGEGPVPLKLLLNGRPLAIENKAFVFPPVADDGPARAGLVRVDSSPMEGDIASLSARIRAEAPPPTWQSRIRTVAFGPQPKAMAALLLVGTEGRYVALFYSGAKAPLRLEWSLGERSGTMLGQAAPEGEAVELEIKVDADGILQAYLGRGRDQRAIAEPLNLGPGWMEQFSITPLSAFGCLEGTCRADEFVYTVRQAPPPGTTAPVSTVVPPVAKAVTASTVPAKAVTPKKPPPPPPPKKQPAKAPPKGGKRR